LRTFYEQVLTGDVTDNIKGCPGIGKAKAPRLLDGCETEQDMFEAVQKAFNNDREFLLNGQLIWIWRKENDIWKFPNFSPDSSLKQETEQQFESTPMMAEASTLSTELGGRALKEDGTP
jgi:5'-3' exonuclease